MILDLDEASRNSKRFMKVQGILLLYFHPDSSVFSEINDIVALPPLAATFEEFSAPRMKDCL